jgi:hypothetical protein
MWLYLIIFFIPVLAFLYKKKKVYGKPAEGLENSLTFLFLFFMFLMIFVGISDMFGGFDRYIYGQLFDETADNVRAGGNIFNSVIFAQYPKELGYDFLNVLISFVTANRYIFILILTMIIYSLTFVSFKRYMSNYPFAFILFLSLWFFFTFTYLRQALAVSISWLAIRYIIDRKFWKFLLIVTLAFLFHNSGAIFLPFYFLPIKKYHTRNIIYIMITCLVIGMTGVTSSLYSIFGDITETSMRTENYSVEGEFRIAYLVEAVFFLYFILLGYKRIPMDRARIVLCNMALVFCGILLFFIKSENGGRLSWFYMIGLISTLTYLLTCKIKERLLAVLMIGVGLFLYLRVYTSWQQYLNLYPYKTFFTNGYREGDFSWENYEYDHGYDKNKFYR